MQAPGIAGFRNNILNYVPYKPHREIRSIPTPIIGLERNQIEKQHDVNGIIRKRFTCMLKDQKAVQIKKTEAKLMEGEKHLLEHRAIKRMLHSIIGIMVKFPTEPARDAGTPEPAASAPMISYRAKVSRNKIRSEGHRLTPINPNNPLGISGKKGTIEEKRQPPAN